MQFVRATGPFEVWFYVICSIAGGWMIHLDYGAGGPPWFFWFLGVVCAFGVVRIFQVAWGEDRLAKARASSEE